MVDRSLSATNRVPSTLSRGQFLRENDGVARISVGKQSIEKKVLEAFGQGESASRVAKRSLELALSL